jgi:hypothetical protein
MSDLGGGGVAPKTHQRDDRTTTATSMHALYAKNAQRAMMKT